MSNLLLVIIITAVVVVLFMTGMSITLIFKGHNIDSEIGDNKHMRSRGIKCAAQQMREEEHSLHTKKSVNGECSTCTERNCGTCS